MAMLISVYAISSSQHRADVSPAGMLDMLKNPTEPQEAKLLGVFDTPLLPSAGDLFTIAGDDGEPREYRVVERIFAAVTPKIITPESDKKFTLNSISILVEG